MQLTDPETWLPHFGLTSFRPGQRQVVEAILSGRDTLCIMPTGGGKSLCYQLPALAREGVTIVVSPLIALMKDQVDSLNATGIPATFINSSLTLPQQQARIEGMMNGEYRLVYVAPERLRSNSFLRAVHDTKIQLLAVDEAHCISQWGHDFRPDYARLGRFRARLSYPQTIALTATATTLVQQDILKVLELREPAVFVTGFARENLNISVVAPKSNSDKDQQLIEFLNSIQGAGIIYASTRKNCEHLVELLQNECSRRVAFYHAGLAAEVRRQVQEEFMSGEIPIIVATNAFGMGIDKSDLRFVIHYNLPGSIEAYYQEAGRAGRDGLPSRCVMLYSFQDKFIQEFFIENSYPSREVIRQIYEYLRSIDADPVEMTLQDIKDELGLQIGTTGIGNCENLLEKANAIERLDAVQNSAAIRIDSDLPTLVELLPREAKTQRRVLRELERICENFRRERVMFSTQRLAQALDMKWEAVNRAIRQLVKLPMVDYIPPFRGRALHVVDRKRRFEDLQIDFDELQRRKDAEQAKLNQMIRFATSGRCRQLEILEYFGDPDRRQCGNCDNCAKYSASAGKHHDLPGEEVSKACLYVAQVSLSGIARTKSRVGKSVVAQMLTGSSSKRVKQLHLDKLSTFALLKSLRQSDVAEILEALIERGFAQQVEHTKFRPVIVITHRGQELMMGKSKQDPGRLFPAPLIHAIVELYRLRHPVAQGVGLSVPVDSSSLAGSPHKPPPIEPSPTPEGQPVLSPNESKSFSNTDLPALDKDSGRIRETIDPFEPGVEYDLALSEHPEPALITWDSGADEDPVDRSDLDGKVRLDAAVVLPSELNLGQHPRLNHAAERNAIRVAKLPLPEPGQLKPSYFWTVQLLSAGYSVEQVEQIRKLDRAAILDHVTRGFDEGLETDPGQVLSAEKILRLREFLRQREGASIGQLLLDLPAPLTPAELLVFVRFLGRTDTIPAR